MSHGQQINSRTAVIGASKIFALTVDARLFCEPRVAVTLVGTSRFPCIHGGADHDVKQSARSPYYRQRKQSQHYSVGQR
jgi:hypothetical protein